jgi:hypothetical protein
VSAARPEPGIADGGALPKKLFLIAYDYGMGGLWGAMLARSEEEIQAAWPELGIAHERPRWMSQQEFERICQDNLYDVDGAPWGLLNVLLDDRTRS